MMADRRVDTAVFGVQELAKCSLSLELRLVWWLLFIRALIIS